MDVNIQRIQDRFSQHIVGQDEVCHKMVVALVTGGHILLTGVPGLGKTVMVKTFAQILNLTFRRIQFTPDLMPSDITGTEILDQGQLRFIEGPVFSNVLLADEINRTPPKTQSALLEAMEERTVTVLGKTRTLGSPFLVLATQNPMEFEGTYPLPEAQLDRFFFSIDLTYLSEESEARMATLTTGVRTAVESVPMDWLAHFQGLVRQMPISEDIVRRIVRLVRETRPQTTTLPEVKRGLRWGAGPRAIQNLILSSRADALIRGQACVTDENVARFIMPVLQHRVIGEPSGDMSVPATLELVQKRFSGLMSHLSAKDKDYLKRVSPIPLRGAPVLLGSQPTRSAGSGGDFFQLRPYVLGDDPRQIAWRLGTRHKQWLVREQVHEGPMTWRVWVDKTASMALPERKQTADLILESIQWVWSRHHDRIRFVDRWTWSETALLIVSDFIWDEAQWAEFERARRQQRIILIRILYPEEARWTGSAEAVEDCETRERLRIDNDQAAIQTRQAQYWDTVKERCRGLPCAEWVIGSADLTRLEGTVWA